MLIRFELLSPHYQRFPAGQYLTVVGLHGTMMMGIMSSAILGPFANYFLPIMIGARRMAFPRIEALSFWLLMAAGGILTTTIFFGGFPTGWTGLRAADRPGERGRGLLHLLLRARRDLDVPARAEPDRHHDHDARARDDLVPAADLHLGRRLDRRPDGARLARPRRRARDGDPRPHRADDVLHPERRRQRLPVREPLLGLRAPRGLHPRDPRVRDRARAAARVRAQAALGLQARRRRDARRRAALLARLAAPPVRQRHQQRPRGPSTCSRPS